MLSIRSDSALKFVQDRQSLELNRLISDASKRLAECPCEEIEEIVNAAIDSVCSITSPEMAGWSPEVFDQCTLLDSIFFLAYQRKLARDDAEKNERRFHQLFKMTATGMAMVDEERRFCLVNKIFCDIIGYSEDELLMMRYSELSGPFIKETLARRSKRLPKASAVGHPEEQMLLRKNGSVLLARVTVTLLEGSTSERTLSLIMVEDIGEEKTTELELNRNLSEVKKLASQLIELQENERKRLSRELHDDIGQRLSLAASEVALLQRQHSSGLAVIGDRLDNLREELDSLCTDLHCLSHSLHSYKLQHLGLRPALKDLCRQMSQPGFHIDLIVDDSEDPESKEISLCLYRVAQEALNNARRHAQTSSVAVTLTKLQHTFYMAIQDSGIGFETSANPQGLGLISMKERLKLVDGQLVVHSILGRGTEIWVAVPDGEDASDHQDTLRHSSISPRGEAA